MDIFDALEAIAEAVEPELAFDGTFPEMEVMRILETLCKGEKANEPDKEAT